MLEIAPFSLKGRFWRGNLHTHSNLSDGALPLETVVEAYKGAGYDFVQMSEHFLERFHWPIADTRKFRSNRFTTLIGAELHAMATAVGELWHIVAAGLPLDFDRPAPEETGPELAARAVAAGAFVGIAHPAWSQLSLEDGLALSGVHAVEVYNHGCCVEVDRGDGWYLLDQLLRQGKRLTAFATDDAHFNSDDAYGGWVHVKAETLEPEVLLSALKAGHYYSSQGPQIHELAIDANELRVACSPVDSIAVVGHNSRSVGRYGRAITEARLNLADLGKAWTKVKGSPWLRIVVIDSSGKRAWSNPIWYDQR
jgi:hypothetical protein